MDNLRQQWTKKQQRGNQKWKIVHFWLPLCCCFFVVVVLNCPFLIASSVFSYVYFTHQTQHDDVKNLFIIKQFDTCKCQLCSYNQYRWPLSCWPFQCTLVYFSFVCRHSFASVCFVVLFIWFSYVYFTHQTQHDDVKNLFIIKQFDTCKCVVQWTRNEIK
jgi:hypothetical protein